MQEHYGETTTAALWSKLENLYMTQSLTGRIFLRIKLYAMRMEEGTKIANHLNVFSDLTCQLTNLGDKFNNEDKVVALLCTLPKSCNHPITSMWFSNIEEVDYHNIVGTLLIEELRRANIIGSESTIAVATKG